MARFNHGPLTVTGGVAEETQLITEGRQMFDVDAGLADPLVVSTVCRPLQGEITL